MAEYPLTPEEVRAIVRRATPDDRGGLVRIVAVYGEKRLLLDNRKVPDWLSEAYRSGLDV